MRVRRGDGPHPLRDRLRGVRGGAHGARSGKRARPAAAGRRVRPPLALHRGRRRQRNVAVLRNEEAFGFITYPPSLEPGARPKTLGKGKGRVWAPGTIFLPHIGTNVNYKDWGMRPETTLGNRGRPV